jgi:hypothetical protein
MNVISFDIGTKNLAYTIITADKQLYFKLVNIDERIKRKEIKSFGRCRVLSEIMEEVVSLINNGENNSMNEGANENSPLLKVVIEKQMKTNVIAMNLMYSLITIAFQYTEDIVVFVPNQKFVLLKQDFSTVNKSHKALSIRLTKVLLEEYYPEKLLEFTQLKKKDDVADSFLMAYLSRH